MKTFPLLLLILMLSTSCVRNDVHLPVALNFSTLTFTGIYRLSEASLPAQGALKYEHGALKLVLMAQQGILLGYGILDHTTGKTRILFARSSSVNTLVKKTGDALAEILPILSFHRNGQNSFSSVDFPANWEYLESRKLLLYHDAEKELSIFLEHIR